MAWLNSTGCPAAWPCAPPAWGGEAIGSWAGLWWYAWCAAVLVDWTGAPGACKKTYISIDFYVKSVSFPKYSGHLGWENIYMKLLSLFHQIQKLSQKFTANIQKSLENFTPHLQRHIKHLENVTIEKVQNTFGPAEFMPFIAKSRTLAPSLTLVLGVLLGVPCRGRLREAMPGWCTLIVSLACTSILYPGGKNVLNPTMRSGWPLKRLETLLITPGVSILSKEKTMS